jgi:hypothetical protein
MQVTRSPCNDVPPFPSCLPRSRHSPSPRLCTHSRRRRAEAAFERALHHRLAVPARRPGRHAGAHAVRRPGQALRPGRRGREPARRGRQHRHRQGQARQGRRPHAAGDPGRQPHHQPDADAELPVQHREGLRAHHHAGQGAQRAGGRPSSKASRTRRNWWRRPRPGPTRCPTPRRAWAAACTWRASCSSSRPASTCCTCPTRARRPALNDVLGGTVPLMFSNLPATLPTSSRASWWRSASPRPVRSDAAPDIPTLAEQGIQGVAVTSWYGVLAPGHAARGGRAAREGRGRDAVAARRARTPEAQGMTDAAMKPAEFASYIRDETAVWARIIKARNIVAE